MSRPWSSKVFTVCGAISLRRSTFLLIGALWCVLSLQSRGAVSAANSEKVRRSEQFIVHDTRPYGRSLSAMRDVDNAEMIQLEPDPLLLCAERVKEALARQLGVSSRGGAGIHLHLYAPRRNDEHIILLSTLYANGWRYELRVPDDLPRTRLVRGLVQALLLDHANRDTAGKSAEIPGWLLEGMTRRMAMDVGPGLIVDSVPTNALRRSFREIRGADPLAGARDYVRNQQPMTFTELCEPFLTEPPPDQLKRYQISAQLFLAHLVEMPDGHARLWRMVRALPDCWNWQTALLRAYDFPRLVDVEKWWSVQIAALRGNDPGVIDSMDRGLARLDAVLSIPAQVRLDTNALPVRAETTLASAITDWDYTYQRPVLLRKLTLLVAMRGSVPRQMAPLIDGYAVCLQSYIQRRDQSGYNPNSKLKSNIPGPMLGRETARKLAELDQRRASLRRLTVASGAAPQEAPSP